MSMKASASSTTSFAMASTRGFRPRCSAASSTVGRKLLSPNGVLYVSYNTYPGWHLRGVVREMMRYHVEAFETPQQKIRQARGLLDFLVKSARTRSQAYSSLLKEEAEILENRLDSYIYHEHLEEYNEPIYFNEFVKRVDECRAPLSGRCGDQLDGRADVRRSTAELLKDVPLLRREQYMDFLRSRMFRCSLLCHQYVAPNYRMASHNLTPLHVALNQALESKPGEKDGEMVWRHPSGQVTTQKPITAAMERLNRAYPAWIPVQELLDEVQDEASKGPLLDALMMSFIRGMMQVADSPPYIRPEVTQKPLCTPLSRFQASQGNKLPAACTPITCSSRSNDSWSSCWTELAPPMNWRKTYGQRWPLGASKSRAMETTLRRRSWTPWK